MLFIVARSDSQPLRLKANLAENISKNVVFANPNLNIIRNRHIAHISNLAQSYGYDCRFVGTKKIFLGANYLPNVKLCRLLGRDTFSKHQSKNDCACLLQRKNTPSYSGLDANCPSATLHRTTASSSSTIIPAAVMHAKQANKKARP